MDQVTVKVPESTVKLPKPERILDSKGNEIIPFVSPHTKTQAYIKSLGKLPKRLLANPLEFHETQAPTVHLLEDEIGPVNGHVLDLGTGRGAILASLRSPNFTCVGVDIDLAHSEKWKERQTGCGRGPLHALGQFRPADVLTDTVPGLFQYVLSNPPFSKAEAIIRRTFQMRTTWQWHTAAFLLPLSFLCTNGRLGFHQTYASDVYPLAERPSFSENGSTNMSEYMWLVFGTGRGGRWKVLG